MNIKPIGYRCLIMPQKEEETKGGLLIPKNAIERGRLGLGKVVAVGKSKRVRVGDVVYYRKMAGDVIDLEGQEFYIVRTKYVFARNDEK